MTSHNLPWLTQPLVITRAVLDHVDDHARSAYPEESCGLLSGPADDVPRVDAALRCENLANRYHQSDPETYPRTAREAYIINGLLMQRSLDEGAKRGIPVKVLYHSHCDCGAYFSAEDQIVAAPEGTPVLPVVYLVTSVREGGVVDDHKLFAHEGGRWVERAFTVE